jgi:hypothetical protein
MAEENIADKLSVQEKLLLAQAVHKLGAINWPNISKLLVEHPCCVGREELFTPEVSYEIVVLWLFIAENLSRARRHMLS